MELTGAAVVAGLLGGIALAYVIASLPVGVSAIDVISFSIVPVVQIANAVVPPLSPGVAGDAGGCDGRVARGVDPIGTATPGAAERIEVWPEGARCAQDDFGREQPCGESEVVVKKVGVGDEKVGVGGEKIGIGVRSIGIAGRRASWPSRGARSAATCAKASERNARLPIADAKRGVA